MINFEDFKKLDIRTGRIIEVEKVEKSDKLLKIIVDIGEEKRQIVSGIAKYYTQEELEGRDVVLVINLEPRKIMGLESEGMILAASTEDAPRLLSPDEETPPGTQIT